MGGAGWGGGGGGGAERVQKETSITMRFKKQYRQPIKYGSELHRKSSSEGRGRTES